MRNFSLFFIFAYFVSLPLQAQDTGNRIHFADYLLNQQFNQEAIFESNQILQLRITAPQKDSLYYIRGWAEYNLKELKASSQSLKKVGPTSVFYSKSQLFGAYNLIYLRDFNQARSVLDSFKMETPLNRHFSLFLRSGIDLLQRDIPSFRTTVEKIPADYYGYTKELSKLNAIADELATHKRKSPLLAGILSGILPGSGQFYSGKTGQGIAALLLTSGLSLVAIENYNKRGPDKFETIFFGSVFTVFYIGNIYGAAFSAKIANDDYNTLTDKQILFNLHIPLRNIFN
jgi:hypothetical protein